MKPPIVVLGGGVIGSSIAYHLALQGCPCVVVEEHRPAGCASGKAAGFLAGGALVFAGGRLPTPAMIPLAAWAIVASLSARSCEGIINATGHTELCKAKLRRQLPGLVAITGVSAYYHVGVLSGLRLSHRMISSALLGGHLLVECSLSHLRHEVDQL